MKQIITATVENGVLKPDQPLNWPSGTRVQLSIAEATSEKQADDEEWDEFDRLMDEMSIDTGGRRMTRDELHERR